VSEKSLAPARERTELKMQPASLGSKLHLLVIPRYSAAEPILLGLYFMPVVASAFAVSSTRLSCGFQKAPATAGNSIFK